ncbi:MAG: DHA2 family efflux MFS transporter permease subunit [Candidatus Eremiobacteraeota bacterium]|nr:DHA2 family efflux MFS transporter permease subunit [Candidatus Eremiobacteraeota bacterium]
MSERLKLFVFAIMAIGMFMALLDIQIVAASLPEITSGLAAGADQGSWIQTSYLIAEIVMIPLSGLLSQAFSTRWVFTASAAAFTVASVACGFANSLETAIFFRAVQGFVGGAMIPTVFATGYALFKGPKQALIPAILGMTSTLAPVIGPSLGGWITDLASWRWLFFINVVPGIAITILVPLYGKIDEPDPDALRGVDWWAIPLMALFLGGLIYVLEEGPRYDWFNDPTNYQVAWASALSGVAFLYRSLTHPRPVVNLSIFKKRRFALGSVFLWVTGAGIFTAIYLIPQFLASIRHFRSLEIGKAVAVTGFAQFFATPIAARMSQKLDARAMLVFGFLLFASSTYVSVGITSEWGGPEFLWPQVLRGFSLMFCIVPATNMCLGSVPPEQLKAASGLSNLMRNLGGAVGIAVANTVLNDRYRLHFARLSEHLTHQVLDRYGFSRVMSLLNREAHTLAFADSFLLLGALFVGSLVLLPLSPPIPPTAVKTAEH